MDDLRVFRHLREQTKVVSAMAAAGARSLLKREAHTKPTLPGPTFHGVASPPSRALVDDFLRHVGGDPSRYATTLPPYLFPQWTFPLSTRLLESTGLPLHRILNAGACLTVLRPLDAGLPLQLAARLVTYDEDTSRVRMTQEITMRTGREVGAIATLSTYLPLAKPKGERGAKKDPVRVPGSAISIGEHRLGAGAGRVFAALTGDVNPIHVLPAAARLAGFRSCILHGFGSFARTFASLERSLGERGEVPNELDLQFVKPLVLPRTVSVFVDEGAFVYVGSAPGEDAFARGTFASKRAGDDANALKRKTSCRALGEQRSRRHRDEAAPRSAQGGATPSPRSAARASLRYGESTGASDKNRW